jgi:hypothetical protein
MPPLQRENVHVSVYGTTPSECSIVKPATSSRAGNRTMYRMVRFVVDSQTGKDQRRVVAYSEDQIKELIECPKTVSDPPKREMRLFGADWRNDMTLTATNGTEGEFSVFMRRNEDFPENFSIGLRYQPNEIVLVRCNGPRGTYNSGSGDANHPHWDFHIHVASEKAQEAGERAEKYASKTEAYASFEEAIQHFLKAVNLDQKQAAKHFPLKNQTEFLFEA